MKVKVQVKVKAKVKVKVKVTIYPKVLISLIRCASIRPEGLGFSTVAVACVAIARL